MQKEVDDDAYEQEFYVKGNEIISAYRCIRNS